MAIFSIFQDGGRMPSRIFHINVFSTGTHPPCRLR